MTFEEKLAAQGRKLDELKAKLDTTAENAKAARQMKRDQVKADIADLDAAMDELDAEVNAKIDKQIDDVNAAADLAAEELEKGVAKAKAAFTLDKATAENIANAPSEIDRIQYETNEQVAKAKGDITAAEENVRLVKEYNTAKRDSVKLHAQMSVDNAKAKIAECKEAVDKASLEAYIVNLMDYADRCQELAYAWALEAEYTIVEALDAIDDYTAKYGKME